MENGPCKAGAVCLAYAKCKRNQKLPTTFTVLSTALYERFSSRGEASFGDKLLSAMRYEFGGHVEKSAG